MSDEEYFELSDDDFYNCSEDFHDEPTTSGTTSQIEKLVHFDEENNKRYSATLLARRFPHNKTVHYITLNLFKSQNDNFIFEERKGMFGVDDVTKDESDGNLVEIATLFKSRYLAYTGLEWDSDDSISIPDSEFTVISSTFKHERTFRKKRLYELEILPSYLEESLCGVLNTVASFSRITYNWKIDSWRKDDLLHYDWFPKETIREGLISLNNIACFFESNMERSDELSIENYRFQLKVPDKEKPPESVVFRKIQSVRDKIRVLEDVFEENHSESNMSIISGEERIRVGDDFLLHPLDVKYLSFRNEITKLDKESNEYKLLDEYFTKTKASATRVVKNIYRCKRHDNKRLQKTYRLLWHGSPKENVCGILRDSLHPPKHGDEYEASNSICRRGMYFADCAAKSLKYCNITSKKADCFLFLFDVALGNCMKIKKAKELLKKSADVIKFKSGMVFDDMIIHKSETGSNIHIGTPRSLASRLNTCYNEYIVHNEKLVELAYLVHVCLPEE